MATRSFDELLQAMRGYQESRLLMTAVELDVFSAVAGGARAGEVAERLGTESRATAMLLNALVSVGALEKSGDAFRNTSQTARFLVDTSPECQRAGLMHSVNLWDTWSTLTECVRRGTSLGPRKSGSTGDPEWTRNFIDAMHRNSTATAPVMLRAFDATGVRHMLDVGGGSGAFSIAFAEANPALQADVFDLPHVTPIAREYIAKAGLEHRIRTRDGDMRTDDLGSGYDFVLVCSICHMFGEKENRELIRRCRKALVAGGRLMIRDFILNEDRCSPRQAAVFALNMLVGTSEGATYTEKEYTAWMLEAGFREVARPVPDGEFLVAFA